MDLIKLVVAVPFIVALAMWFVKEIKPAAQIVAAASWAQLVAILCLTSAVFTGQTDSIPRSTDDFINHPHWTPPLYCSRPVFQPLP